MAAFKQTITRIGTSAAAPFVWGVVGAASASLSPFFIAEEAKTVKEVGPIICIVAVVAYGFGYLSREEDVMRVSIMKRHKGWIGNALFNILVAIFTTFIPHDVSKNAVYAQMMIAVAVFGFIELAKPVLDFGLLQFALRLPFQTAVTLARQNSERWALVIPPTFLLCFCTIWQSFFLYTFDAMRSQQQQPPRETTAVQESRAQLPTRSSPRVADRRAPGRTTIRAFRG